MQQSHRLVTFARNLIIAVGIILFVTLGVQGLSDISDIKVVTPKNKYFGVTSNLGKSSNSKRHTIEDFQPLENIDIALSSTSNAKQKTSNGQNSLQLKLIQSKQNLQKLETPTKIPQKEGS